ncbi:MAG TPA: thioredoxin-like domain-containing protein [Methylomirabilota bacterium]|nr:thioredoxin-like domain-containing protein [Methylomirabilota bacterium]
MLSPEDAAALAPTLAPPEPVTEADLAWKALEEAMDLPTVPAAWLVQRPTDEEIQAFQIQRAEAMVKAADVATNFAHRFPDHERAAQARQQAYELLSSAVGAGFTNRADQLAALENALLGDPNVPEEARVQMRVAQLMRQFTAEQERDARAAVAGLETAVRQLQKDFARRDDLQGLLVEVARFSVDADDLTRARALAREVAEGPYADEVKSAASSLLKKVERLGKPLALRFKAIDGREVDLAAMKGRVVLVDFWATWCGPCMKALPEVKAAYERFHPRGFDIVGISFDHDKEALVQVVNEQKLPWPQYFHEGEGDNPYAVEFDVAEIPTLWLVDKNGHLRHLGARDGLSAKIEALLAE